MKVHYCKQMEHTIILLIHHRTAFAGSGSGSQLINVSHLGVGEWILDMNQNLHS